MTQGIDAFLDYLKAEQARGITHVSLDGEARAVLRTLHQQLRNPTAKPKNPQPTEAAPSAPVGAAAAAAPEPTRPAAPIITAPEPGTGDAAEKIARLRAQAEQWQPALRLDSLRKTMVFSTGNPAAKLVLIGEAPGYEEEKRGEPFTGPAGKKLDDILKAMGIEREEIYLTNIVKNRPAMARQATNNRKPTAPEMEAWLPFVKAELEVLRPSCIVVLGATAAEGLLGGGQKVADLRDRWHDYQGIPVRVTYHPSYLLRTDGRLGPKRQLWEDMLAVMEHLNMPISEKQRGYFLPRS